MIYHIPTGNNKLHKNSTLEGCNSLILLSHPILLLVADKNIQDAAVQYILDTVMDELGKNKDRKFIYVEMAFFIRWWNEQTDDLKEKVSCFSMNYYFYFSSLMIISSLCSLDRKIKQYSYSVTYMSN